MKKTQLAHFLRNHVRSISSKDRINFFRQMAILTHAGIGLLDALKMLQRSSRGPIKSLITDTIDLIEQGSDFSTVGKYYIKFFDKTMAGMIKAGESTGTLPETMNQVYENLKRSSEFSKTVRGAMIMPISTLIVAIGVFFFMALKVIPTFSAFLSSAGTDLPALTVMVVDLSSFIIEKWKDILIYTISSIVLFIAIYVFIKPFRNMMHHVYIKIPLIGPIILYSALSNFSNSMAKLLGTGISVVDSIHISNEGGKLLPFKSVTEQAIKTVTSGGDISRSFYKASFIPSIFCDLVKSGEMSGTLDTTFEQLSQIYREETNHKVSILEVSIQPIMTILIGLIVGVIAGALIMGMVALWSK
jgi:type IV pilus assembly protein PilC